MSSDQMPPPERRPENFEQNVWLRAWKESRAVFLLLHFFFPPSKYHKDAACFHKLLCIVYFHPAVTTREPRPIFKLACTHVCLRARAQCLQACADLFPGLQLPVAAAALSQRPPPFNSKDFTLTKGMLLHTHTHIYKCVHARVHVAPLLNDTCFTITTWGCNTATTPADDCCTMFSH